MTVNLSMPRLARFSNPLRSVRVRKVTITKTVLKLLVMINSWESVFKAPFTQSCPQSNSRTRSVHRKDKGKHLYAFLWAGFFGKVTILRYDQFDLIVSSDQLCDIWHGRSVTWFTVFTYVNPDRLCDMVEVSHVSQLSHVTSHKSHVS